MRRIGRGLFKLMIGRTGKIGFTLLVLVVAGFALLNARYPLDIESRLNTSVTVYAKDGDVLRQFATDSGIYRIPVNANQVSDYYLTCLLEYEDKYFYHHFGVNPFSLVRAAYQQLRYGRVISGGSTITMQVARLFYPHHRTYAGKLQQIFRALQLELNYSKDQILTLYLTYAPMGGNIEGVEAASQRYFGKSAQYLSPAEAALLVAIPQRPTLHRPDRYPFKAFEVRNKVLRRAASALALSDQDLALMLESPLNASRHFAPLHAPLLARRLKTAYSEQSKINTFIHYTVQVDVEQVLASRAKQWSKPLSAAVMVMDNRNGEVIAYKGSAELSDSDRFGYVDMTRASRSPGSTLKPFIYGLALDRGLVGSGSLLIDVPSSFAGYRPKNFDLRFDGAIRLDKALQKSKNVPAVQVLYYLGPSEFVRALRKANIELEAEQPNLAIALGGVGVRLEDLVALFSAIGREGEVILPRYVASDLEQTTPLLSPGSSWIIRSILQDIAPPDRVKPAYGRKIAWKTGTSYGYRDAWAVGSSERYTVGVWIGRPDGAPYVGQTGANQAGPVLFDIFDLLPQEQPEFTRPASVQARTICWPSGLDSTLVKSADCLQPQPSWTLKRHTPPTLRDHSNWSMMHQWPEPLEHWARRSGRALVDAPQTQLTILAPKNNSQIFPYQGQVLALQANDPNAVWYLNDQPLELPSLDLINMPAGQYRISACNVRCDSVSIILH